MAKEIEAKILGINVDEIAKKIESLGGKKKEIFYKIYSYKLDDGSSAIEHARLRDDGEKITLTYKKKYKETLTGTQEIEFEVLDFDKAADFMAKIIPEKKKYYQERKRWLYEIGDVEICIDFWPKIKPFLEIESNSTDKIIEMMKKLGIEKESFENPDITTIYLTEGLNIHDFEKLTF